MDYLWGLIQALISLCLVIIHETTPRAPSHFPGIGGRYPTGLSPLGDNADFNQPLPVIIHETTP